MRFNIKTNDLTIHEAASIVETHSKDPEFLKLVALEPGFNHTRDTGEQVAHNFSIKDPLLTIVPYKTWNPYSKTIGYQKGDKVYYNIRKKLELKDRVKNLFHEATHKIGYGHEGNYVNTFNDGTVPYRTSEIFVRYLESIGEL